ncbi:uncharacterized protein CTRU02_204430 [Colletotrichum truncatum]|uniref:Uncharacterized protein n=1 Tax=Colletotrichum truncatum TaxID=5467 RepID=A0ACC3ZC12_COLTU
MSLKVLYLDTDEDKLVGIFRPAFERHVLYELEKILDIHSILEKIEKRSKLQTTFIGKPNTDVVAKLYEIADQAEGLLHYLRDIEQTLTLRRVEDRLAALYEVSDQYVSENQMMRDDVRSLENRLTDGGAEEEEIRRTAGKLREDYPELSPGQTQKKIEEIRDVFRSHFGGQRFQRDPMCFPFIIPVRQKRDVVTRVKLDTGSRRNWISVEVLRKAGLSYEVVGNLGQFIGASKTPLPFEPLGQATVTWFSENQALTTTSDFLVHDGSLPFDVVLGSKWMLEDVISNKLSEPLLPIRHIITKEDLQQIETQAREDGASNEQLIELHKQQSKEKRAEKRLLKAASARVSSPRPARSSSATGTVAGVSRHDSMTSDAQSFHSAHQTLSPTTALGAQTGHSEAGNPPTASSSQP